MRALQRRPRAAMLQASAVKGRAAQLKDGAINSLHGRSGWRQARRGQWHSLSASCGCGCGCGCGSRVAADARGWSLLTITNPSGQPRRRTPPPPSPPSTRCTPSANVFLTALPSLCTGTAHTPRPPAQLPVRLVPRVLWCLVPHLLPDHVRCTLGNCRCPRAGFTDRLPPATSSTPRPLPVHPYALSEHSTTVAKV